MNTSTRLFYSKLSLLCYRNTWTNPILATFYPAWVSKFLVDNDGTLRRRQAPMVLSASWSEAKFLCKAAYGLMLWCIMRVFRHTADRWRSKLSVTVRYFLLSKLRGYSPQDNRCNKQQVREKMRGLVMTRMIMTKCIENGARSVTMKMYEPEWRKESKSVINIVTFTWISRMRRKWKMIKENIGKRSTKARRKFKIRNAFNGMVSHSPNGGRNRNTEVLHKSLENFAAWYWT